MAVSIGGKLMRVLAVHRGDYLEPDDHAELLVCLAEEDARPEWVMPRYATVLLDDPTTRSLVSWYADAPSFSSTPPSRPASSSSSGGSSGRSSVSSTSSGTERDPLDLDALVERLRSSVENHPSDAAWHLLAHAERDILLLVKEVRRLRRAMAGLPEHGKP